LLRIALILKSSTEIRWFVLLEALALFVIVSSAPAAAPYFVLTGADLSAVGCCVLRDGTNGWDWSDKNTREECLRSARAAGLDADGVYHYPNEACSSVKTRCGPNPCN
jgi:hypothetical protein